MYQSKEARDHVDVVQGVDDKDIAAPLIAGEDDDDVSFVVSNVKWKRKRYLMMNDIRACLADGHAHTAVRKAEEMMNRWWKLYKYSHQDPAFQPSTEAYNLWMHAMAKAGHSGAETEQILDEMQQEGLLPNVVSYSVVMDAYAKQSNRDPKAAAAAERIMFDLIGLTEAQPSMKVSSITCDTVLNAWARQGTWDGAERAEQILYRLETMQRVASKHAPSHVRPTAHSYAAVMDGWAKCSGGGRAATRAQNLLNSMLRRDKSKGTDKDAVRPDTVVFNACINAWATSRDPQAGTKAVQLLHQMRELQNTKLYFCPPDVVTYNSVLSAWSHCGHVNAASHAEKILQEMRTLHQATPEAAPEPNTDSYNNVLNAWANSPSENAAKRAETILSYMIRSKVDQIAPDSYSFTAVLNALAKSKEPDKAVRARDLLDTMLAMYAATGNPNLRPTPIPFNIVLNAAAFSKMETTEEQQRAALQVAVQTFTLMRSERVPPDEVSYGNLLKTFANLLPSGPTRTTMALNVFTKCCDEGKLGELAWNEVRRVVAARKLAEAIGDPLKGRSLTHARVRDLPRHWSDRTRTSKQVLRSKSNKQQATSKDADKVDEVELRRREPVKKFRTISEPSYQSNRDL